jgi:hypothetical protein
MAAVLGCKRRYQSDKAMTLGRLAAAAMERAAKETGFIYCSVIAININTKTDKKGGENP